MDCSWWLNFQKIVPFKNRVVGKLQEHLRTSFEVVIILNLRSIHHLWCDFCWILPIILLSCAMSPVQSKSLIMTINVGGSLHSTYLATLTRFPDSMLAAMFSGKHTMAVDRDGNCFIDRDSRAFSHILNFLRSPEDFEPALLSPDLYRSLQSEARYYGLLGEMFPFKPRTCSVSVGSIERQNLIHSEKKIDNSHYVDWAKMKAVLSRNDAGAFFISCCPGHQSLRFENLPLTYCETCGHLHTILQPEHHSIVTIAMPQYEENSEDRRLILHLNWAENKVSHRIFRDQHGSCFENHD